MKNTKKYLACIIDLYLLKTIGLIILLALFTESKSQNIDKNISISLQMGLSKGAGLMENNIYPDYGGLINNPHTTKNLPSILICADYALGDVISVGGTFSFNKSALDVEIGQPNISGIEPANWDGKAFGIGSRMLFHFLGKKSEKVDFYGGLGLHLLVWSYEYSPETTKNIYTNGLASKADFLFPITLGCRYYINNNLGITAEAGTNGISLLNLGMNYRFSAD